MIHRHGDGTEEWMAEFRDNEGRPLALMCQAKALAESPLPSGGRCVMTVLGLFGPVWRVAGEQEPVFPGFSVVLGVVGACCGQTPGVISRC